MKKLHLTFILCLLGLLCLAQTLSGTYTVGGDTPDYITISDATKALMDSGITGDVTFNIRPGTYNEQIDLGSFDGGSCDRSVIFQSESGDTSVTIAYAPSNSSKYIWKLDTAYGVTIKNLRFKVLDNEEKISRAIEIFGGDCNRLESNVFYGLPDAYYRDGEVIFSKAMRSNGEYYKGTDVFFNTINFGYTGIYSNRDTITIHGNKIINQSYNAISFDNNSMPLITSNQIIEKGISNGVELGSGNCLIYNNFISVQDGVGIGYTQAK